MKKNISINIGGIIFHIEEDGYDRLKNYLDSVNMYFSSFEDSREIIEDIEGRIAEIFLSRLDEGKQIINKEDVDDLIATMGTTKDFEASIETEPEEKPERKEENAQDGKGSSSKGDHQNAKRLYRDTKRKVIGGVAAGIANYFSIDPIWVRLLMLAFFFNIFFWGLSGFILLTYIILWIAVPGNDNLEDEKAVKKLFRSTDDRVLGGVSGGIASYFGTDPVVIRVLFILSIFLGGAGILVYLILWIIVPEARSITEKMQMQGEPVTITNIEENVKKSLNVKEGEENVFIKILLFPFRLIAMIFNALGEVLGPLLKIAVEVLRICIGVFLVFLGFVLMISFTICLAIFFDIGGAMDTWVYFDDFPARELFNSMSTIALVSSYIVSMIPSLALVLIGLVIVLKKKVTNSFVAWSMFGLWLLGMIGLAFSVPATIRNYSAEGTFKEERRFTVMPGITHLKLNELDWDAYRSAELKVRGYEDTTAYLLEMEFDSRGYSRNNAKENAEAVDYLVIQEGNTLLFDSEITFNDAPFRFQEVSATLYVPYGKIFTMDRNLGKILRNTLWLHGYNERDLGSNEWVFDDQGLTCLTCEEPSQPRSKGFSYDRDNSNSYSRTYQFKNFDELTFISLFDFEIIQGDNYTLKLEGDNEDYLDDVYIHQNSDELEIRYGQKTNWWKYRKRKNKVKVFIEMPQLEHVRATGACEGEIRGFITSDISLDIEGASSIWADVESDFLQADLSGASELVLIGKGEELDVELSGASKLDAFNYVAEDAEVNASGASTAKVNVKYELEADASGASTVRYRGAARVSLNSNGLSSIKKD